MEFSEQTHSYRKNGVLYTPVSDFLKKFEVPFAKGLIAEASAKKSGGTAEDLIAKWDLNADISRTYGTAVHKAIEYWIRYGEITRVPHLKTVVEKFAEKHDRTKLKAEIIVDNDTYQLAGTIDQLEVIGKKKVKVKDVKTNADLAEKPRGYFLPPIADLPHSKLNKYRLQLSTYKWMLEQKGFEVTGIELEHWTGSEFTTIVLEPVDINPLITTICQTSL